MTKSFLKIAKGYGGCLWTPNTIGMLNQKTWGINLKTSKLIITFAVQ